MIRIFISIIIYLITLLTQAQAKNSNQLMDKEIVIADKDVKIEIDAHKGDGISEKGVWLEQLFQVPCLPGSADSKFAVTDKDLTFEIRINNKAKFNE